MDRRGGEASLTRRRGLLLVLSSPSGAGKTTLTRRLLAEDSGVRLSISVTTRPRRLSEVNGVDYNFIDREQFAAMIRNGELLEYAEVFGNLYGTPRRPVEAMLAEGHDVLFDIDWQGAKQLIEKVRPDLVTVFVLPPSIEELERRLRRRAEDPEEAIRVRMEKACEEISHYEEYDYIVVNHDLEQAFREVQAILAAERLRRERQVGLAHFVASLRRKA
ncbi:MAG TPA: guanylate kinase [Xanthobacteraceae bacterium]|nr:guanylate kinase [Xanthobacteraceae bacterium]